MTKTASAPWLRVVLAAALSSLAACSTAPAGAGALHVIVKLEPGTVSQCVIVTATDGTKHGETNKMPVDGQTQLDVAILANGMSETVTVQAIGYVDAACTTEVPGEASEPTEGHFTTPANTITITISPARPDGGTDGGSDAGTDGGTDGGSDGGSDGGLDLDLDGWPQPADCNDGNPNIHPGMTEACTNGVDDDCDQLPDCEDTMACQGRSCANGGTCMGTVCVTPTEMSCDDRADNDGDQLTDCADPDCAAGTTCNDGDGCTTGDRCVSDGGCESTGSVMCMTPPNLQCWAMGGTCERDAGATCSYTQLTGGCDDGNACTTGESCANGSCGGGTATACGPAPTCRGPGTCQPADGGCVFPPLAAGSGSCSDGNNCTLGDTCDGDGGCAPGTAVSCTPPSQCHQVNLGACEADGGCTYSSRAGQACDAGMGVTATCNTAFACVAQGTLFPFVPSNFTESNLADAGTNFSVTGCNATIDTTTPSITSSCGLVLPAFTLVTQPFGGQAVLFRVADFSIEGTRTLTITGTRPAIFAATGNINIPAAATLRARNAAGTSADCGNGGNGDGSGSGNGLAGGGGGGFGSAGGLGGTSGGGGAGAVGAANGNTSLIPLRGGCNGGAGGATAGGAGGGAVQLVSANALTIGGLITAPGRGGGGAQSGGEGGGGGGSGGGILLEGNTVSFSGVVSANGGGGGEGSGGSNGNPGGDGTELIQTGALGGSAGSLNGGNGGAGGARLTTAGDGVDVNNNDGAGGGGGGVGRIRIKGNASCSLTGSTSPVADVSCP